MRPRRLRERLGRSRFAPLLRRTRDTLTGTRRSDVAQATDGRSGRQRQADQLARQDPDRARLLRLEASVALVRHDALHSTFAPNPAESVANVSRLLSERLVGDRHLRGPSVVPESLVEADTAAGSMLLPGYDGYIVPQLLETGMWEPEEHAFIMSVLARGMTVVDIGAHVGFHTLCAARAVGPSGRVVAIEASPPNFALLCANIERNAATNVVPVRAAAAAETGTLEFTLSHENSGGSRAYRLDYVEPNVTVPAVRLDDVVPDDAAVHLVKVDIEGMDHRALAGMERVLDRWHPIVLSEFFPEWIRFLGDDPSAVLDRYRELGYRLLPLSGAEGSFPRVPATGSRSEPTTAELITSAESSGTGYLSLVLQPI